MESALTLIIWGSLFIVGPPALLFWLIRRRRRRERAARDAASSQATALAAAGTDSPASSETSGGMGFSFPYGLPIVIYPLLAIALSAVERSLWGTVLVEGILIALACVFTRMAFDKKDFEKTRANDPTLNLLTWRINWLLFFALPPALLALYGVTKFLRG